MSKHRFGDDLVGASRLVIEATRGITTLVEDVHRTIASGPAILGKPLSGPAALLTGLVYGQIRGVTDVVGSGLESALSELTPFLGEGASGPERDAVIAALNGVVGDYLASSGNPLAIPLTLRPTAPTSTTLVVCVHGSCMSAHQWQRNGHDHGEALAAALGGDTVYAQYNSGLHISENGRDLSHALDRLVQSHAIDRLVLVGHSMGGLVSRSAIHVADTAGHLWRQKLTALVTLGTPHHGAPLERIGNWVAPMLGVHRFSAPFGRLARIRSAGVTDLRYGNVRDEDWNTADRFETGPDHRLPLPLPADVPCFAVAGDAPGLPGDGLVPVDSALGRHDDPARTLAFERTAVVNDHNHLDLLGSSEVFGHLRTWLTDPIPDPD